MKCNELIEQLTAKWHKTSWNILRCLGHVGKRGKKWKAKILFAVEKNHFLQSNGWVRGKGTWCWVITSFALKYRSKRVLCDYFYWHWNYLNSTSFLWSTFTDVEFNLNILNRNIIFLEKNFNTMIIVLKTWTVNEDSCLIFPRFQQNKQATANIFLITANASWRCPDHC